MTIDIQECSLSLPTAKFEFFLPGFEHRSQLLKMIENCSVRSLGYYKIFYLIAARSRIQIKSFQQRGFLR